MYPLPGHSWNEDSMFSLEEKGINLEEIVSTVWIVVRLKSLKISTTLHVDFKTSSCRRKFLLYQPKSNLNAYFYFLTYQIKNFCWTTADTQLSQWTYFRQLLIGKTKTIFAKRNAGCTKRNKNQN